MNIFSGSPPKVFSVGLKSVPVCFGVMRKLMQHPLGECGGLKLVYKIYAPRHGNVAPPPSLRVFLPHSE